MINIYQILPRLFTNLKGNNIPNGTIEENGCGKMNDLTLSLLKEIRNDGYTHLWLTGLLEHATKTDYSSSGIHRDHPGVVKGQAGSPYAIKDYYDIDPDLAENVSARMNEFESLLQRIHKAGLKLIIDFVPNHVAREYHSDSRPRGIKDLGADDNIQFGFSQQNNFYYFPGQEFTPQFDAEGYHEYPAKASGNDVFHPSPSKDDWYETVKLNYGVDYLNSRTAFFDPIPDTWFKMRDILLFWAGKGVDGFRCDMAEMVPVEFWGWVLPQVKAKHKNILFIAEVYNPYEYRNYIFNGHFDYLYDKVGTYDILRSITCHRCSASALTGSWQSVDDIRDHMLNFLENHDEQRIASDFFAGNARNAIPALIVSSTLSSSPFMVYAGQELGERGMDQEGFSGKDGRTTLFDYWTVDTLSRRLKGELNEDEKSLYSVYRTLLNLRLKNPALSEDSLRYDLQWLNYDNHTWNPYFHYAYLRQSSDGKETLLIAVNFNDEPASCDINITYHPFGTLQLPKEREYLCKDLLTGNTVKQLFSKEKPFHVELPARSGVIMKIGTK